MSPCQLPNASTHTYRFAVCMGGVCAYSGTFGLTNCTGKEVIDITSPVDGQLQLIQANAALPVQAVSWFPGSVDITLTDVATSQVVASLTDTSLTNVWFFLPANLTRTDSYQFRICQSDVPPEPSVCEVVNNLTLDNTAPRENHHGEMSALL